MLLFIKGYCRLGKRNCRENKEENQDKKIFHKHYVTTFSRKIKLIKRTSIKIPFIAGQHLGRHALGELTGLCYTKELRPCRNS